MTDSEYATFGGSIKFDVRELNKAAIPEPDTLFIRMTRGKKRIANHMRNCFGSFRRVVIDVDGEQHEFDADSFIGLLESYEEEKSQLQAKLDRADEQVEEYREKLGKAMTLAREIAQM